MTGSLVQLGKYYDFIVSGTSHYGEGIGRIENFTIFEERIRAKISEIKRNYTRAELEEIILSSSHRIEPLCSFYDLYGGCHLQRVSYAKQLEIKKKLFKTL